jgi:peptide/nickel transport system substrate-binding protein
MPPNWDPPFLGSLAFSWLDRSKREALLHQIQQLIHERVMFGPIWEYIWPSGIGPRVEEPALMLINPYPWSAPLEAVRLKPE